MVKDPTDDSHIEMHLGEIAFEQKQYDNSLKHYQHVANYRSDFVESWASLAMVYSKLEQYDEAEANYKRAIEPDNEDYYYTLSEMFAANKQAQKAIEVLEEGFINNPDSAIMNLYLALRYIDIGDYRQAEIFIEKAERLDPDEPKG